jgi:hypothetical protein
VLATASGVVGWEDVAHRWESDSGPMQGHSWLKFEVSRVLIAQQNVPCLLLKGEKLVCCLMKSIRQQSNYKLDQKNR